MRYIQPDWSELKEAEVEINTYSGDPDEWIIYEQNEKGVYYPSFIRYGEFVPDIGKKASIQIVENGAIITSNNKIYVCDGKYDIDRRIYELTNKIVEKERDLTEDEINEIESLTLEMNTHFAA